MLDERTGNERTEGERMMASAFDNATSLAVVGAGVMGRGIAQLAAQAGLRTLLFDAKDDAASAARSAIADVLRRLAHRGRMTIEEMDEVLGRISVAHSLTDLQGVDVVVEAIVEDLAIKRRLFAELESLVSDTCVLASNTSSLSITAIAAGTRRPARVAGFHFFNPAPLMKIVEIVAGVRTDEATVAQLVAVARRMGHRPVRVKDMPGFLINHAGRGYVTEALRILAEGVAQPVEIDRIMRDVAGFRMGPFELLDLTGLDVSHPVMESIYHQFYEEPRFRPSAETGLRLAAGVLGRKVGRGFYEYSDGKPEAVAEPPLPPDRPEAVWISAAEPDARAALLPLLTSVMAPGQLETGALPSAHALCLVTPLGVDATTTAIEQQLDPQRVVAVDPIFAFRGRLTLMPTPLTLSRHRREAHGLLGATGVPVTAIADSPGFVAQRVLATIANIGCDIAQQRIAAPTDIDDAVCLGLGYPLGPLALGDRIGPSQLLRILKGLQRVTGDPRYRASLWLRRRAMLDVSLTTSDLAD